MTYDGMSERVAHAIDASTGDGIDASLVDLRTAADAGDLDRIPDVATTLSDAFAGLMPVEPESDLEAVIR